MNKARFWFATGLVVVPAVLAFVYLTPGFRLTRSGPVEGWVSYHGRPLSGGSILFVPDDPNQTEWAHAWLDRNGHYVIGSSWLRVGSADRTHFRICVIPHSHEVADKPPPGPQGQGWGSHYAGAWSGMGEVALPPPSLSSGFPQRLSNPRTSKLEVLLGSEPARIDVAL